MNNDYLDPINAEGMPALADAMFALDFVMAAKNGVRNCAFALSECATPEARAVVHRLLQQAIAMHDEITQLSIAKGWLKPYQITEQFAMDLKSADTAYKLGQFEFFPGDTSRLGTFATPFK